MLRRRRYNEWQEAIEPMTAVQAEHTFADLISPPDEKLYELIRGQLVEKRMGFLSIWIASQIMHLIQSYLDRDPRGWVSTELPVDCFRWIANHARRPDVVYFHRERLPTPVPTQDPIRVAPNWVTEVLSPNDNALDVDEKIDEYLRAGVELVWIVNPQTRIVRVHRGDGVELFHESDTITGQPVLPDFHSLISEFFPKSP